MLSDLGVACAILAAIYAVNACCKELDKKYKEKHPKQERLFICE